MSTSLFERLREKTARVGLVGGVWEKVVTVDANQNEAAAAPLAV